MSESNPEILGPETHELVVLDHIARHHALAKANRILIGAVTMLVCLVFGLSLWLMPRHDLLQQVQAQPPFVELQYATRNPALSVEIDTLKSQLFGLLSGSIESKLRMLEDSVKAGQVSISLNAIEDLKGDVKILRSYSDAKVKVQQTVDNQQMIAEVSHLRDLIYMTVASCGIMIAAIVGIWIKNSRRLTHQKGYREFLGKR